MASNKNKSSQFEYKMEKSCTQPLLKSVFFGGLPKNMSKDLTIAYFSHFGQVTNLNLQYPKQKDKASQKPATEHRGSGELEFQTHKQALKAVNYNNHQIEGIPFQVRFFVPDQLRKENEKKVLDERRKIYVQGIPPNYPKSTVCRFYSKKNFFIQNLFLEFNKFCLT